MIALVVAAQLAALADADRVELVILRDAGVETCPADEEIAHAVRDRLGSEPFRDDASGRQLRVGIAKDGDGLVARIALFSPRGARLGVRVIHGDADCASLENDLVLAVAIAIDPLLLVRAPPPKPVPPPPPKPPEAPTEGEPEAVAVRVVPVARNAGWSLPAPATVVGRGLIGASGGVGVIASPSTRAVVSLGYGVLDVDLGVRFDLPSRYPVATDALLDLALLAGSGATCLHFDLDANFSARGCGALEAGGMAVQAIGLVDARPVTAPWLAVGARGGLDAHIWPELGLVLEGGVLSPLLRPRFVDDATGRVYAEPSILAWDLELGAVFQIR